MSASVHDLAHWRRRFRANDPLTQRISRSSDEAFGGSRFDTGLHPHDAEHAREQRAADSPLWWLASLALTLALIAFVAYWRP